MGRPKEWLTIDGESFLARLVRCFHEAGLPTIVAAAPGRSLPPVPEEVRIAFDSCPGQGPLSGFETGLSAIPATAQSVFLTSCDVPLLRPDFVRFSLDLLETHEAAVPFAGNRFHPLVAAYRVEGMLARIRGLLARGCRRLQDLLDVSDVRIISEAEMRTIDPGLDSLRNINTPEDYLHLVKTCESSSRLDG